MDSFFIIPVAHFPWSVKGREMKKEKKATVERRVTSRRRVVKMNQPCLGVLVDGILGLIGEGEGRGGEVDGCRGGM